MQKDKIYVVHFCKNKNCNNAWLDEDLTNAKNRPPRWKYCKECCEKFGFTNPKSPPKKKLSAKQEETIQKHRFQKRKKSSVIDLFYEEGV
jgi:hypothetical protein